MLLKRVLFTNKTEWKNHKSFYLEMVEDNFEVLLALIDSKFNEIENYIMMSFNFYVTNYQNTQVVYEFYKVAIEQS